MKQTYDEMNGLGYKSAYGVVEVTDYNQVDAFLEKAQSETGKLDIVVNNAGIVGCMPFLDADNNEVHRLLNTNVMGANNGTQAALKRMIPLKGGKIVNISSFTGHRAVKNPGDGGFPHYGMTKAAVLYMTQSAAYAGSKHNVNVNSVCPGIVRTDMWEEVLDSMVAASGRDREVIWKECLENFIPLARADQKAEDIAYAVLFLSSTFADHITGQSLNVDGGASMD